MRISPRIDRWFTFDDDDNSKIKIRHITESQMQNIFDRHQKQRTEYSRDMKEPKIVFNTDRIKIRETILCHAIVSWENFFDENGKKMICNDSNKIRCMHGIDGFEKHIDEFRLKLENDISDEKSDQKKT